MSAAPTAETRVRFVVEYRADGQSPWKQWETLCEADEEKAIQSVNRFQLEAENMRQSYQFRAVRETSVITREVLT